MKLATFSVNGRRRVGVVMGEEIVDLTMADDAPPRDMTAFLRLGVPGLEAARRAAAKGFETTCPMGPWLVTADEVKDPHDLRLRTWVNDKLRQDSNTGNMIFDVYDQIVYLSTVCTLEPGDIISTGTPFGVGGFGETPRWLKPGDVVAIEIEGMGRIANPVVDEPPDSARL